METENKGIKQFRKQLYLETTNELRHPLTFNLMKLKTAVVIFFFSHEKFLKMFPKLMPLMHPFTFCIN